MKNSKDLNNSQPVVIDQVEKKEKHKKSRFWEIVRFVITGGLCTIIDAGVFFLLMKFVFNGLAQEGGENGWGGYLAWGISTTISFLVSCLVNFFISRLWVYQNVDKKINTKTPKAFWTYVGLSALGWLLGLGLQEAGVLLCNQLYPDLNLTVNFTQVSWTDLWNEAGLAFWAFAIIFVIKTCVTLVYNYLTRKFIIFKAPKKDELAFSNPKMSDGMVVTASEENNKKKNEEDKKNKSAAKKSQITTKESFQEIFHEEVNKTFGDKQKKVYEEDAVKIVREELQNYDEEHGRRKK